MKGIKTMNKRKLLSILISLFMFFAVFGNYIDLLAEGIDENEVFETTGENVEDSETMTSYELTDEVKPDTSDTTRLLATALSRIIFSLKEVNSGFLSGAQLQLDKITEFGGDVVDDFVPKTWTSENRSEEFNLLPGFYRITETMAPNGYIPAAPIEFQVNDNGEVQDNSRYQGYAILNEYPKTDYIVHSLYLRPEGSKVKGTVVYCFNKTKNTPPDVNETKKVYYQKLSGTPQNFDDLVSKKGELGNGIANGPLYNGEELVDAIKKSNS